MPSKGRKGGSRKALTPEQEQEIRRVLLIYVEEGLSPTRAAKRSGVEETAIRRWLGDDRWRQVVAEMQRECYAQVAAARPGKVARLTATALSLQARIDDILTGELDVERPGMEVSQLTRALTDVERLLEMHGQDPDASARPREVRIYRGTPAPRKAEERDAAGG